MIGQILLIVGTAQGAVSITDERVVRLELLRRIASASFYADDLYKCQGLSPKAAHERAKHALGQDFDERLDRASEKIAQLYGKNATREATEVLAIGYKITPQRCAKVRSIVEEARDGLTKLEVNLGAN